MDGHYLVYLALCGVAPRLSAAELTNTMILTDPAWTTGNVVALVIPILALLCIGFLLWHYRSVVQLNKSLRRTENMLLEKQRHLSAILDYSPALIYMKDMQGNYWLANRQFEKSAGLNDISVVGKTDAELFGKKLAALYRRNDLAVLSHAESMDFEEPGLKGHGSVLLSTKFPLLDQQGKPYAIGGISTDISARVQAESVIRQSEAKYRRLVEALGADYFLFTRDVNGKLTFVSPSVCDMLGYQTGQFISLFNDTFEKCLKDLQKMDRSGQAITTLPPGHILTIKDKHGQLRELEVSESLVKDSEQQILAVDGIAHDVTLHNSAQRALRSSEAHYRSLVESSAAIPWELNSKTMDFEFIGPQVESILGYAAEQWRPAPFWLAHLYREDASYVPNFIHAVAAGNINENVFEFRVYHKKGHILWLRGYIHRITEPTANGDLRGFMFDITEARTLQQTLRENQQRLQSILDNMVEGMITIDQSGFIGNINRAAESMFGFKTDEIAGRYVALLLADHEHSVLEHSLQQLLCVVSTQNSLIVTSNVTAKRRDGKLFPIRLSFAELPRSGKIRNFIVSVFDNSLQVQQEEQLRRAQKMEALGKLTGGITHDYNNMLGVILGYAEILEDELANQPSLAAYAREIQQAGRRGKALTEDLLSFTKPSTSDREAVDVNQLLRSLQSWLSKTLTARIQLELDLCQEIWAVFLAKNELEDAILNLSINAMQAMPNGGHFSIRTSNVEVDAPEADILGIIAGNYVRLSFTDDGLGMDAQTKSKVFDPFFTTKGDSGSGLGLSQVYGFVQRAKGGLRLESQPQLGSCFSLYFPRYDGKPSDISTKSELSNHRWDGNESILVVDDEPALRTVVQHMLSSHGYHVEVAENAKQALEMLAKNPTDLLISDVIMPDMDGYELANTVKRSFPQVKIQLASGFSENEDRRLVDQSMRVNMIHKPFSTNEVLKQVRLLLDK